MKKNCLFLLPIIPVFLFLTSCGGPSENITYGFLYSNSETAGQVSEFTEYGQIESRMGENQPLSEETFLLLDYGESCSCKLAALDHMKSYSKIFHTNVYAINKTIIKNAVREESKSSFGLDYNSSGSSQLYVISKKQIKYSWTYSSSSPVWQEVSRLHDEIIKIVKDPNMNLCNISETYLDECMDENNPFIIEYKRDTCGDCTYIDPNIIWKKAKERKFNIPIYCFDINGYRSQGTEIYQEFKDLHFLSTKYAPIYGYDADEETKGVVPTIQYWNNGSICDACVSFNDVVELVEGITLTVTNSYYSEERLPYLKYLYDVKTKILKGMALSEEEVIEYQGSYYWKQESSAKYHTPILEAFINHYCFS